MYSDCYFTYFYFCVITSQYNIYWTFITQTHDIFKTVTTGEDFGQMIFTVCTQHKINEKWIRLSWRFKMGQKNQQFLTTVVMIDQNSLVSGVD